MAQALNSDGGGSLQNRHRARRPFCAEDADRGVPLAAEDSPVERMSCTSAMTASTDNSVRQRGSGKRHVEQRSSNVPSTRRVDDNKWRPACQMLIEPGAREETVSISKPYFEVEITRICRPHHLGKRRGSAAVRLDRIHDIGTTAGATRPHMRIPANADSDSDRSRTAFR
jgi:hypothetical protein